MNLLTNIVLLFSIKHSIAANQPPTSKIIASVHQCIHYSNKVMKLATELNPPVICLKCDPTTPFCDPLCQNALNYQYAACHGVCLPDGFFFDVCKNFIY